MTLNLLTLLAAYANTNAASKLYVCSAPQNSNLSQGDYEALDWTLISSVGDRGETGRSTNIVTYDTWDDTVTQKGKGLTDAGSPTLEVARIPTDAGQIILNAGAAVGNNNSYAFKEVRSDGAIGETGTVIYNRGLITGPTRPGGRNEDFDLEIFTLGLVQEELVVNPTTAGTAPQMTVAPAITGTNEVGETLTVDNGTFTGDATIAYAYSWYAGGVAIAGATASTYDLTASELGKVITARVHATNDSGSAFGYSAATSAVTNP